MRATPGRARETGNDVVKKAMVKILLWNIVFHFFVFCIVVVLLVLLIVAYELVSLFFY